MLFDIFYNQSCDTIISEYMTMDADEQNSLERPFIISYSCILSKDSKNARIWMDRMKSKDNDALSLYRNFLLAHIHRLELNFIQAAPMIDNGLESAKRLGRIDFLVRFFVIKAWLCDYLGQQEIALYEIDNAKASLGDKELGLDETDLINAVEAAISRLEENEGWSAWARYYYAEILSMQMLLSGKNLPVEKPEYYRDLFGSTSCLSSCENWQKKYHDNPTFKEYDDLSPNQRLYCELYSSRPLSVDKLNDDSFYLFGEGIVSSYLKNVSAFQESAIVEAFVHFWKELNGQVSLAPFKSILSYLLSSKRISVADYLDHCADNGFCLPYIKRDISGVSLDHQIELCLSNLQLLVDLNTELCVLSLEEELSLRAFIYRYGGDEDNAIVVARLLMKDGLSVDSFIEDDFFNNYTYFYQTDKIKKLIDNIQVKSIVVDRFIKGIDSKSSIEKILNSLGEYELDFLNSEKDILSFMLELNGWNYQPSGENCWLVSNIDESSSFYLYFFGDAGIWDVSYYGTPYKSWRNDKNEEIPSPLSAIDIKDEAQYLVFMSGAYVSSPDALMNLEKNVFAVSLPFLLRSIGALEMDDDYIGNIRQTKTDYLKESVVIYDGVSEDWDFFSFYHYCEDNGGCCRDEKRIRSFGPTVFLEQLQKAVYGIVDKNSVSRVVYECRMNQAKFIYRIVCDYRNNSRLFAEVKRGRRVLSDIDNETEVAVDILENGFVIMLGQKKDHFSHRIVFSLDEVSLSLPVKEIEALSTNVLKEFESHFVLSFAQLTYLNNDQIRPYAEKTAKIAIMARNMSHNLGSHVMFYIKQHLSSVNEMLRHKVLDQLFCSEEDFKQLLKEPQVWVDNKKNCLGDVALPFLVGLGKFISYIQERQDFIACVATDFSPSFSTLNFKDFIYDELNPDKRYRRHSNRKGLKPANLLLGYIAKSEGFSRESRPVSDEYRGSKDVNDLVIKFRTFDGEPVEEIDGIIDSGFLEKLHGSKETLRKAHEDLEDMRKYSFSVPGGVTGRHAFFSILENIIRNAAKHGRRTKMGPMSSLELTIDIFDCETYKSASREDMIDGELSLHDVLEHFYVNSKDSNNLFFMTITDNLETSYETLNRIRGALVEPYVDEDSRMLEKSKGLKEMRICAAWLRGMSKEIYPVPVNMKDPRRVDHAMSQQHDSVWKNNTSFASKEAPTLYARLQGSKEGSQHLQFIIGIRKPKSVLLISDATVNQLNVDMLHSNMWDITTSDHFCTNQNIRDYDFFLLEDDKLYNKIRPYSGAKLYCLKELDLKAYNYFDDITSESDLEKIYMGLLKKASGFVEGDIINIFDDKAESRGSKTDKIRFPKTYQKDSRYIYKSHYDSIDAFNAFNRMRSIKSIKSKFVESITGNNSTDRLVRSGSLDEQWFYRHLRAMKMKVALIDERLYDSYLGVSPEDNKAALLADKGVQVFNMIREKDSSFALYGWMPVHKENSYNGSCVKLLSFKGINEEVVYARTDVDLRTFDFVSIHQGLIDKMCDVFGIIDIKDKQLLTEKIYGLFSSERVIEMPDGSRFLPGMSIHSGRSRPPMEEMPQKMPFVQYASLEHAVTDCKYTLVHLLDCAYYEGFSDND